LDIDGGGLHPPLFGKLDLQTLRANDTLQSRIKPIPSRAGQVPLSKIYLYRPSDVLSLLTAAQPLLEAQVSAGEPQWGFYFKNVTLGRKRSSAGGAR
jgi:hypothetical protein